MIRLIILLVITYFAFRYYGWLGASAVIGAYVILLAILSAVNAGRNRQRADVLVRRKMSEAEKAHLSAAREHQQAMEDHRAQFDPELRKSRGQQQ